ncbi:MAG: WD40 repeat protein [Methylophagaceae bacterium]|jgi:WD40 repeat protein
MALRLTLILMLTSLLSACFSERQADKEWAHSELSSYAAAFSPNGKYVLVGDTDGPAKLWHIEKNRVIYSWQNTAGEAGTTTSVAFSADGKVAATAEVDTIVLWEMANGKPMVRLTFPVRIKAMTLSKQGDYVLLALQDRTAVYFDVIENRVVHILRHDGKPVGAPIDQLINAVAISPSGQYALTGGDDKMARLWSLDSGKQLRKWKHETGVNIVSFYPKGGYALTGAGNDQTHFWNIKTGDKEYTLRTSAWPKDMSLPDFPSFKTTTSAVDFSANHQYLVTGHPSQRICLWQVATGDKLECWRAARRDALRPGVVIQAVSFSPKDKAVYTESGNGIGQKWPLKD